MGLTCSGCGSSNVIFDPETRTLTCNQCGNISYYSRATLNRNGKVLWAKENAITFFKEGQLEQAMSYAHDVLNISKDNIPALFIVAYCDEFRRGKPNSLDKMLQKIEETPDVEYDEIQELKELFLSAAPNLNDYEKQILRIVAKNQQSEKDKKGLLEFIDCICPYFITNQKNSRYLDDELISIYKDYISYIGCPKTCFQLLKSIQTNNESPFVNDDFHFVSKAKYYQQHYMTPIRKLLESYPEKGIRMKFIKAYEEIEQEFMFQLQNNN